MLTPYTGTIREAFKHYGFDVNVSLGQSGPVLKPNSECGDRCTHPQPCGFEEFLDADLESFGNACELAFNADHEALFNAACELTELLEVEEGAAKDIFRVASFSVESERVNHLVSRPDGVQLSDFEEDLIDEILQTHKVAAEKAFLDWVNYRGSIDITRQEEPEKLVYVTPERYYGFGFRRIIKMLYGEVGGQVLKVPKRFLEELATLEDLEGMRLWVKSYPPKLRRMPCKLLGGFPVEDVIEVEVTDDAEVLETLTVLVKEMPLREAVLAARNLKKQI